MFHMWQTVLEHMSSNRCAGCCLQVRLSAEQQWHVRGLCADIWLEYGWVHVCVDATARKHSVCLVVGCC